MLYIAVVLKMAVSYQRLFLHLDRRRKSYHNIFVYKTLTYQLIIMTSQLDVRFEGEPGEGYGVARSFFALIAQELVKNQNLPKLDPLPNSRSKGINI